MKIEKESKRIGRLTERVRQFNEEFDIWVNGDFKQLVAKVHSLAVDNDGLFANTEVLVKRFHDLVVLAEGAEEKSREVLQKIKSAEDTNP